MSRWLWLLLGVIRGPKGTIEDGVGVAIVLAFIKLELLEGVRKGLFLLLLNVVARHLIVITI